MTGRRLDRGDWIDRSELIDIVQRQPELQNKPGAEFNYNNTGFGLLATVVERVGGKPFPDWMKVNIFEPLGMEDTFVRANPLAIIERASQGYVPADEGGYRDSPDLGGVMGAGSIYTTVGDLAKRVKNFSSGELGGNQIFEQMSTPYKLSSGKSTGYGFGLYIGEYKGQRRIHHSGGDTAHRSRFMYFPDLDSAVITQSNNSEFKWNMADSVADLFFGSKFESKKDTSDSETSEGAAFAPKTFEPWSPDEEQLAAYVGTYFSQELETFVRIVVDGEMLVAKVRRLDDMKLSPTEERRFVGKGGIALEFEADEDGEFKSMVVGSGRTRGILFKRVHDEL